MSRDAWFARLSYLLLLSGWFTPSLATVAEPPSFLQHAHHDAPISLDLRAPAHLHKRHLDHDEVQQFFQSQAGARKRSLFLPRQSGQASDNLTQSSTNRNDKLQSIGFLDGAYDVPLNISSNPTQLVFVQLDTGSSDLWITSTSCRTPECENRDVLKFDPAQSSTFQALQVDRAARLNLTASSFGGNSTNTSSGVDSNPLDGGLQRRQSSTTGSSSSSDGGQKADIPFGIYYDDTTAASGIVASDKISISDLSVDHQAFALINATNVTLGAQGISGVLGLGFPRGSVISRSLVGYRDQIGQDVSTLPFMTSILQTSNESYPMFGLYLTRDGGRATLGAVDPQVLPTAQDRAQVEWYDVYPFPSGDTALPANNTLNIDAEALGPYVQWVLPLTGAGVAGNAATLTPTYPQISPSHPLALLDSGSSSIVGPASDVESIFSHILNSRHVGGGRFVVPCDTTARMYFSFGGRNITLLPSDYIIGPDAQQPYLCFAWPSAVPPDATGVDWILGTPFLRAVYSLYSIGIDGKESPKIGLYPLRQPASATASSVVFAPEPTAALSSFLQNGAVTINSLLPNELVTLTTAPAPSYFFGNATVTPSLGVVPTIVGAPSTYRAILPTTSAEGAGGVSGLPVIASSSTPLPVPNNPAATGTGGGGGGSAGGGVASSNAAAARQSTPTPRGVAACLLTSLPVGLTLVLSVLLT